jgi:hypothetical protein
MKHVKSYEAIKDGFSNYKKYIIGRRENNDLVIIEVGKDEIKRIYSYNENKLLVEEFFKINRKDVNFDEEIKPYILFTTNDLKKCIDILPTLINSEKYNL